jgi:hypothetical protein
VRESKHEKHLCKLVARIGGLCEKHTAPAQRAVPDRLITWPWGSMDLVETKATGKKARADQLRDHARRARRGVSVAVLNSMEKVDAYVLWKITNAHRDLL